MKRPRARGWSGPTDRGRLQAAARCLLSCAMVGALLGLTAPSFGAASPAPGDAAAGRRAFRFSCAACHGVDAVSVMPLVPNLRGQKAPYLVAQLKAYRDGQRKDPTMDPVADCLSDDEIDDLAMYLSGLDPTAPASTPHRGMHAMMMDGGRSSRAGAMSGMMGAGVAMPGCGARR